VSIGGSIGKFIAISGSSNHPEGNIIGKLTFLARHKRKIGIDIIGKDVFSPASFNTFNETFR